MKTFIQLDPGLPFPVGPTPYSTCSITGGYSPSCCHWLVIEFSTFCLDCKILSLSCRIISCESEEFSSCICSSALWRASREKVIAHFTTFATEMSLFAANGFSAVISAASLSWPREISEISDGIPSDVLGR